MGADLYMNPPKEQCKKCGEWVEESLRTKGLLCTECYIKSLKAHIKKLKRALRVTWVGSALEFKRQFGR